MSPFAALVTIQRNREGRMVQEPELPPHVEETVAAIARLHVEHQRHASPARKFVARATALVSRPRTLALINDRHCDLGDRQSRDPVRGRPAA